MSAERDPLAPCTDHGCVLRVEPSGGMGTSGGCWCLVGDRDEVRRLARHLAADRRRLAEQLRLADALAHVARAHEPCPVHPHGTHVDADPSCICCQHDRQRETLIRLHLAAYLAARGAR